MCQSTREGGVRCPSSMFRSVSKTAGAQYTELAACVQMLTTSNPDRQLTASERESIEAARKAASKALKEAIDASAMPDEVKEKAHALREAILKKFIFDRMAHERRQDGQAITPGVKTRLDQSESEYETAKKALSDSMKDHSITRAQHGEHRNDSPSKGKPKDYAPKTPTRTPRGNSPRGPKGPPPPPAPDSGAAARELPTKTSPRPSYSDQSLAFEATQHIRKATP